MAASSSGCRVDARERGAEGTEGERLAAEPAESEVAMLGESGASSAKVIKLPAPDKTGGMSLNRALVLRRSIRQYRDVPLFLDELSQLLWSAQGLSQGKLRTCPSAGATFPLETYVAVGNVTGVVPGLYLYDLAAHELKLVSGNDIRKPLSAACLGQKMIVDGGATIIFAAEFERTTRRYGDRGVMYVHQETGHAGQNVYLQATALGLGTVAIGAFDDDKVAEVLRLPKNHKPLYLFPIGKL